MPRPDGKPARPGSARASRGAAPRRGGPGTLQLALGGTVAACALFAGILLAAWLWQRPPPDAESRGTAFRVGRDGLWLTAGHVVAACRATPEIVLPSGRLQPAPVKRLDAAANLALLDTGTQDEPLALRLGQAAARRDVAHAVGVARAGPVGLASVYVVTAPRAIDESGQEALRGVWATRRRAPEGAGALDGMDGAPLVDAEGAVVGVLVSTTAQSDVVQSATSAQIAAILGAAAVRAAAPQPPVERRVEVEDLAGLRDRLIDRGYVRPIRCAAEGPDTPPRAGRPP